MREKTIRLECPVCHRGLKIDQLKSGKTIVCPRCNSLFKMDDNQRPVAVPGRNELFGPPVQHARSDERKIPTDGPVKGAFEDIDHLFEEKHIVPGSAPDSKPDRRSRESASKGNRKRQSALPSPDETLSQRRRRQHQASREQAAQQSAKQQRTPRRPAPSASEVWAQQKQTMSKSDERLQRNGIGLLILAVGLGAFPFIGQDIEELKPLLPWMPVAAVVVAVVGSFLLALSQRRAPLAGLLRAAIPLICICLLALGAYLFQQPLKSAAAIDDAETGIVEPDANPDLPVDDRLDFNADEINNNPASKFVPPRKDRPLASGRAPVVVAEPNPRPADSPPGETAAPANESGIPENAENTARPVRPNNRDSSTTRAELARAVRASANDARREILTRRTESELIKGFVSRDELRRPDELKSNFVLSETAGQQTVYGIARFHVEPIQGIDAAFPANDIGSYLDMIVPIVGPAEFSNSIAPANRNSRLSALEVVVVADEVRGIRAVFTEPTNRQIRSSWLGLSGDDEGSVTTISAGNRKVYGVVTYKNGLKTTGVALILSRQ